MSLIQTASEIWRRYVIAGVPASGVHEPEKAAIVAWGTFFESMFNGGMPALAYATLALLNADLAHGDKVTALVYDDDTAANNGMYANSGATGVGSWGKIGDLPSGVVTLTVTGGTANAIVATAPETPTMPGSKLYLLTPTANNSGATTIAVNGGSAVPIKNAFGVALAANSLVEDQQVLLAWSVDHYQLLISAQVDASAILAAALAAASDAADSEAAAAASAAALGNQVHQYDTRAQAAAATIPVGVAAIRITRYAAGHPLAVATYIPGTSAGPMAFQEAGNNWWELDVTGGAINLAWFGAVPLTSTSDTTTDSTTAIQAALDIGKHPSDPGLDAQTEVIVPYSEFGYGHTGLFLRKSALTINVVGGASNAPFALRYIGTGAAAKACIRADYTLDHGGENFINVRLGALKIDGGGKALHGLLLDGFTRDCGADHIWITRCVNPIKATNCYYSTWGDIECISNQGSLPSGMLRATFDANKHIAWFSICHLMTIRKLRMHDVGGVSGSPFTYGLFIGASESVSLRLSLETVLTANSRYIATGVRINAGSMVELAGSYFENDEFSSTVFSMDDNTMLTITGSNYFNNIAAPNWMTLFEMTPVVIHGVVFGENMDIFDRMLKSGNGSVLNNVVLYGNFAMHAGPQTGGTHYDGSAVAASFGLATDAVTSAVVHGASASGTIHRGYQGAIASNYILVTEGRATINGIQVSNARHSGITDRLFPDLTHNGTWNLKISSLGSPFIEKQSAVRAGSTYAKAVATFATAGNGTNPTGYTAL